MDENEQELEREVEDLKDQVKDAKKAEAAARMAKARAARAAKKKIAIAQPIAPVEGSDELTKSELAALEAEVEKEVRAEKRKTAKAELKKQLRKRFEQSIGVGEQEVDVFIDLGGGKHNAGATYIMLDGQRYLADQTYRVRAGVAQVLRECMQNAESHQAEIEGKSRRFYRERNTRMGPVHLGVTTSQLLKA